MSMSSSLSHVLLLFNNSLMTAIDLTGSPAPAVRSVGSFGARKPSGPSPEQQQVIDLVRSGKSLFFTGVAGTGKSYTLKLIGREFSNCSGIYFTAMTGVAASLIPGGTTLHSFAGIGRGDGSLETVLNRVKSNRGSLKRWKDAKILVIDEVSMLSRHLFEVLDGVAKAVRYSSADFGGIQLVLVGDFFQLPPVMKGGSSDDPERQKCFESPLWSKNIKTCVALKTVFRQNDMKLVKMLNDVRYNNITKETVELIKTLARPIECPPGLTPTQLLPTNNQVEAVNERNLAAINSPAFAYECADSGADTNLIHNLNQVSLFQPRLTLKVGAAVMLLKNYGQQNLFNGSCGVVVGFKQSALIERNVKDKVPGSVYMPVLEHSPTDTPSECLLPIVRFADGREYAVGYDHYEVEGAAKNSPPRALRKQIPLRLAWAMTIHKSQGMSIDLLVVDLANVFEAGQAYVALSRARTLEGLQVRSFNPQKCWCDPKVVRFYQSFENIETPPVPASSDGDDARRLSICSGPSTSVGSLSEFPTTKSLTAAANSTSESPEFPVVRTIAQPTSGKTRVLRVLSPNDSLAKKPRI